MAMPRGFWPNGNNGYGSRHIYDTAPFYLWDLLTKRPRNPTREDLKWLVKKYDILAYSRYEYLALAVERLPRPLPLTLGGIPVVFEIKQKFTPFGTLTSSFYSAASTASSGSGGNGSGEFHSYGLVPRMWSKVRRDLCYKSPILPKSRMAHINPFMQASPEHVKLVIEVLRRERADFVAVTFAFGHVIVELRPGIQHLQCLPFELKLLPLPVGIADWKMIYHMGDQCFLGDVRMLISCRSETGVHEVGTWSVLGDAMSGPIPAMCEGRRFVETCPGSFDKGEFEMQDVYRPVYEGVSDLQGGGGNGHLRSRL